MILKNCKINGTIRDLIINNGKFSTVSSKTDEIYDLKGKTVIPGLVDIHIHGVMGQDTMDGKFDVMSKFLSENGTTSYYPTAVPTDKDTLMGILSADTKTDGAQILGFHYEGPYLSKSKKGALDETYLITPNDEDLSKLPNVKMMTVSPSVKGVNEFIKNSDYVISLGHTDCSYDEAKSSIDAGANCVTHLYNAMPPLLHREPSLIGAAIDKNIYVQIIVDGKHIERSVVYSAYKTFGSDRMILISDAMSATGLPDGEYTLGTTEVIVKNSTARTKGGALAGSTSTLWDCVKTAVNFGIAFNEAVKMATETPANLMGINKGRLEPGCDADFLIISDDLEIEEVYIAGKKIK